ncbi:MAG TPA: VOC family protein [Thermodesulfobacteriota bacterium]|nr:VOC family protein [Thermodesulfobacteriota bacterium]
MNVQMHHIHLLCSQLGETVKFFSEVLGAKFIDWRKFQGADGAALDLRGTNIFLRVARDGEKVAESNQLQYGLHHIGVAIEDMDQAYSELTRKKVTFTSPPKDIGDRKVAFIEGPDQISVELIQFKK